MYNIKTKIAKIIYKLSLASFGIHPPYVKSICWGTIDVLFQDGRLLKDIDVCWNPFPRILSSDTECINEYDILIIENALKNNTRNVIVQLAREINKIRMVGEILKVTGDGEETFIKIKEDLVKEK